MPKQKKPARQPDTPDGYYDVDEAAYVLGVHRESLLRAVRRPKKRSRYPLTPFEKPSYRTHRKYYFKIEEVEAFKLQRETLKS